MDLVKRRGGAGNASLGRAAVAALAGIYFVVACTWGLIVPLFGGPDEPGHFIRAVAVIRGELIGRDVPVSAAGMDYWATTVELDRRYANANLGPACFARYANAPACRFDLAAGEGGPSRIYTSVGRYPPLVYAVYGLASVLGTQNSSVYLARMLNALVCAFLFAVALWAIRDRPGYAFVALVVAIPPGTTFMAGMINPSGPELTAAVALWLMTGRLLGSDSSRGSARLRIDAGDRFGWMAAAVTLCATRALGPFFALVIVVCSMVASELGWSAIWARARRLGWLVVVAMVAGVFNAGWYLAVFEARTATSIAAGTASLNVAGRIVRTIGEIPALLAQMIGNFGWLDTPAPSIVTWSWITGAAIIVAVAFSRGTTRLRLAMGAVAGATLVLLVVGEEQANTLSRQLWAQGRHIEPLLLGVLLLPVFARSEPLQSLSRHRRSAIIGSATLVAVSQLHTLRRYAIGLDNYSLIAVLRRPVWQPPATAMVAVLVVLVAMTLAITGGSRLTRPVSLSRPTRRPSDPPAAMPSVSAVVAG